ncbi:retinol dehydrogenase 13 [Nilaparvata lugens]|uniref:retinol dehydrogenase 13 n=1 Tax=Nilaparvata lugens TaxID=108931 RepID=UPI000B99D2A6|nr:retinol dehydrogenase 13 [Nilaparvata lugens]
MKLAFAKPILIGSVIGTVVGGSVLLKEYLGGEKYETSLEAKGKVVIVTGANTGIGQATALQLAQLNATVVMACRDSDKCELEREKIVMNTKNKYVYCRKCDLASQDSIRQFVDRFNKEHTKLDILVNNAAVMNCPRTLTEDGIETQLGVNHMGHFLLTNLLLDKLKASAPSRIITLCDSVYHKGVINTEDLNSDREYDGEKAYYQSKLANMLFTQKLSRDLQGSGVTVNSVDPGTVDTELLRHTSFGKSMISMFFVKPLMWPFLKSPRQGGQAVVYAALDPNLQTVTGKCLKYRGESEIAPIALNTEMSEWLWLVSSKWTDFQNTNDKVS